MNTNNKQILVVSPEPDFAKKVSDGLSAAGVRVVSVLGISEAADWLKKGRADLIIIECPSEINPKVVSQFLLQPTLSGGPTFLVAKEKRSLDAFNGDNLFKFGMDEIILLREELLRRVGGAR